MAKKPRTEKQLANDRRLAEAAKARKAKKTEEEFEPTEVKEAKAKAEAQAKDNLAEPKVDESAEQIEAVEDKPQSPPLPATPQVDMNLVATIVAAMSELQKQNPQIATATPAQKLEELESITPKTSSTARVGQNGVQGIIFRYEVDKGYYPDPTQRLLDEPRLQRFAMRQNYIFKWSVDGVEYKKDNITYAEPRFTLELFRRLYNDDGDDTGRAALVARSIMHEDEMTTRITASRMNLLDTFSNDDEGFRELMNEVRYWRIQQWLFGIFTPPKIQTHRKRPTTEVIAGKVVEVFDTEELTDHDSASSKAASLATETGIGNVSVPQ